MFKNGRKIREGNPYSKNISARQRFIAESICLMDPSLYNLYESIYFNSKEVYAFIGEFRDNYEKRLDMETESIVWDDESYTERLNIYNLDYYEDVKNVKEYVGTIDLTKSISIYNQPSMNDKILYHEVIDSIYDINFELDLGTDSLIKYQCMAELICLTNHDLRKEWNLINHDEYQKVKDFVNKYKYIYTKIKVNPLCADVHGINPWTEIGNGGILLLGKYDNVLYEFELQTDYGDFINYGKLPPNV